jgi:AraC-like DNA-binding protein
MLTLQPTARGDERAEITVCATLQRDMYESWLSFLSEHLLTYSLSPGTLRASSFKIAARSRRAGGFTLARFTTANGRSRLVRAIREIGIDNRDGYVIYMPLRGQLELTQFERTQIYNVKSLAMLSVSDPLVHIELGDNDTLCFLLPRAFVDQRIPRAEDLCVRLIARENSAYRLLGDTMLAFERNAEGMSEYEFAGAARIVADLALLAISGSLDALPSSRSVRSSNLARVKAFIRRRLMDPDLTLNDVARGCGLSLRYVHDLFQRDGRTASEYVMDVRLRQARRMLETGSSGATTVINVSLACGFVNSSHFSTVFRRTFGVSPREVLRGQ